MHSFHIRFGFAAVAVFALASLSSCTKQSDDGGNTLRLVTTSKIKGMDPAFADDLYSGTETSRVYEGLLQYHYLKRPYELIPNLAEAMPEIAPDGKVYTFKLRKGVVFQDDVAFKDTAGKGREVTADDVIYSFKRLADPKLNSSGWWVFDGKIAGLNEWRETQAKATTVDYAAAVGGLKATDRYTLRIQLNQRSYQFIYALAMSFAYVVPREAVDHYGKEFLNHPVGTGPFKMTEFNGASKIVYVRNPTYRKEVYPSEGEAGDKEAGLLEDAGKPLPLADKLVVSVIVESQPMWLNFLAGKLDATSIPKDNFSTAITPTKDLSPDLKAKNVKLHKSPSLDVTHESFNMKDPLFGKNKYLRQALSLAHNTGPLIETFYNGQAVAAQGPIPPGLAGYDAGYKNPYRQFDLEKAKAMLAKAGYPGGKGLDPIDYATVTNSTSRQMNEYLSKAFADIGVQLKINSYSWPEFQSAVKNKKGQMWGFAWGADYPDAENFLQLFYSKNVSPGPNDANYQNPAYDKLYEKSLTLRDSPERTKVYQDMQKMLVEDAPWIFGVHRVTFALTQPWLKNYKLHEFDYTRAKYLRVEPSLKK